tara:strand:- start:82 stop:450 length:369 start_codon:yes stop_codon:yes gene_type:complete
MKLHSFDLDIHGPKKKTTRKRATKVKVSASMKKDVWDRQKGHCNRCGERLSMRAVEYDHIKEVQHGGGIGGHKLSNIQALCANCHRKKTNRTIVKKTIKKREDREKRKKNNNFMSDPLDLRF